MKSKQKTSKRSKTANRTKTSKRNKRIKRSNKGIKKTIRKIKGGKPDGVEFLGQDSSGCRYAPGLKCFGQDNVVDKRTISKVMSYDDANVELRNNMLLDELHYDTEFKFHLPPPTRCSLDIADPNNEEQRQYKLSDFTECTDKKKIFMEKPSILNYQSGGIDFKELDKHLDYFHPRNIFSPNGLPKILDGIIALQKEGLVHGQIKNENIVTGFFNDPNDPGSTDFKLIDFGSLAFTGENIKEDEIDTFIKFKTTDILSGPRKKIKYTSFDTNHIHYPLYNLLFNMDEKSNPPYSLLSRSPSFNTKVSNFYKTLEEHPHILNYYKYFYKIKLFGIFKGREVDIKEPLLHSMLALSDIFTDIFRSSSSDYASKRHLIDTISLIKRVDFYSFCIVLLNYIEQLEQLEMKRKTKGIIDSENITFLVERVYEFITNLGDNNPFNFYSFIRGKNYILPIDHKEFKKAFDTMCKDILSRFG